MKKEILFAVFIGLSLGLIITYGAYRAKKSEQEMAAQTTQSIASSPTSQEESNNKTLSLFSPEDESIQSTEDIKVTGTTTANAFVVIFIGDDEHITRADESGNFSIEANLEKGSNVISVHAIDEDGKVSIAERVVIYSTADITGSGDQSEENTASESAKTSDTQEENDNKLSSLWQVPQAYAQEETNETASDSSTTTENLKERIQRVVKEKEAEIKGTMSDLSKKKQGFIGEVERVSGDTLSVNTNKDTRIIAIDDSVTLLKDNKEIKTEDIAVGDWLVVMGLIEDDQFVAKRILVSSESLRPKSYTVALGSIEAIAKNNLTFQARSESETKELSLTKSTSYQDLNGQKIALSDLSEEMQALVIYYEPAVAEGEKADRVVTVVRALTAIEAHEE